MRLKQKLKTFFKTKDSSEHAVEFLRMFLIPFIKMWDQNASVDDAIAAFFSVNDRRFFHGTAMRDFKMPGLYAKAGDVWRKKLGARNVRKGQYMLVAADRKTQDARIDITIDGKYLTFKVTRAEFEFIKDYVHMAPA